jgi:hypothetical protein
MKELSPKGEAETVKKVCGALVLGKEDSLKETHQGCLSAFKSPFSELFVSSENAPAFQKAAMPLF